MDNRSIGIFDSGIGGLTAVKEMRKALPNENIVYFGDTARLPYGTRGRETLLDYIDSDLRFMETMDVKAVIIACGSASSTITEEMMGKFAQPIYTVIGPASYAAAKATKNGKIGIIGTSVTIRGKKYENELRRRLPDVELFTQACPLFPHLVENGYIERDNPVTELVARDYLKSFENTDIDTLILGCTHFPVISELIGDIVGRDVALIDPGKETADFMAKMLNQENGLNEQRNAGSVAYYVSDSVENFTQIATIFLEEDIGKSVEMINISQY